MQATRFGTGSDAAPPRLPRVLFLARQLGRGGAERQLAALAIGLKARGCEVAVLVFYAGGAFEDSLRAHGIQVEALGKSGRWDLLSFIPRARAAVRRYRPDVLHSYLVPPNILAALLKPLLGGTRVAWGVRASEIDWSQYDWSFRATFAASCLLSRLADVIIANSRSGVEYHVRRGYPASRMVMVPNGIDVAAFAPRPGARAAARERWGVSEDALVVGHVGRLDPMKGHATLIRAFARIREAIPATLVITGGGGDPAYLTSLQELAAGLGVAGSIRWLGEGAVDSGWYAGLDLFLLTSAWGEGFPNVLAEAMACEVPVVATDVGDAAEVVGNREWVARVGQPDEVAERALAVLRMTPAARAAMGTSLRTRVVTHFSVDQLVDRTLEALAP